MAVRLEAVFRDVVYAAIAVRHDADLRILCRIRRSAYGDVYFLIPRDEPGSEQFSEVFEIDHPQIPPEEHHTLAVDLVEPGYSAIPVLGREAIVQRTFRDAAPWILVTLWRGMPC